MPILALLLIAKVPQITPIAFDVRGISGDGRTVIGMDFIDGKAVGFVWTKAEGTRKLLCPTNSDRAVPTGISDDGQVIVGYAWQPKGYEIVVWENLKTPTVIAPTREDRPHPIISGDGTWVYFQKVDFGSDRNSVRLACWRKGHPLEFPNIAANAISKDGKCQVGTGGMAQVDHSPAAAGTGIRETDFHGLIATRWEDRKPTQALGIPKSATASTATICNSDASLIGVSAMTKSGDRPYLWSRSRGLRRLSVPKNALSVNISCMSDDGHIIAGTQQTSSSTIALLWIDQRPITLLDEARRMGLPKNIDWSPKTIEGISKDGRTLVGFNIPKRDGDAPSCWLLTW